MAESQKILMALKDIGFIPYTTVQLVFLGIFQGIRMTAPIMWVAAVLGMVKRNHIFVMVLFGVQIVSAIVLIFLSGGIDIVTILCLIGIGAWYMIKVMKVGSNVKQEAPAPQAYAAVPQTYAATPNMQAIDTQVIDTQAAQPKETGKKFCSKCGTPIVGQISFCAKCGTKV